MIIATAILSAAFGDRLVLPGRGAHVLAARPAPCGVDQSCAVECTPISALGGAASGAVAGHASQGAVGSRSRASFCDAA